MTEAQTSIRLARASDLDAIKRLADAERPALGFVRRPALAESIARDEVLVAEQAGAVVGFVEYHQRRDGQVTLYHIAVTAERRGEGVGRALIDGLRTAATAAGATPIALKCPVDLPANAFYRACGFALREVAAGRARPLNVWTLPLPPPR